MCCDGICEVLYGFGMDFDRVLDGFWGSKWGENEVRMRCRFEK